MREIVIRIEGMSCEHCVMQVRKALETLGGIRDSEVSLGTAAVHFDETRVKREDIEAAIEAAGYTVSRVTR